MILVAIKSSVILFIALCAARVFRRHSAAVRHMTWKAGLIAALTVPLLTSFLPSWPVAYFAVGAVYDRPQSSLAPPRAVTDRPYSQTGIFTPEKSSTSVPATVWLFGSALAGVYFVSCGLRLARLAFRSKPLTSERWLTAAAGVARGLGLKHQIRLLQDTEGSMLGTWGVWRGRILLPRGAETWPEERMRVVLSHEMAHIQRFDWLVQMIAEAARAIYWFNPLFWIACKQLRRESEHACDDVVLNLGIDGQTYAAHLLELARDLKYSGRAWSPMLAMAQPPHLERRFVAMLNPSLNHRPATRGTLVLIALAAVCLTVPVSAMQTQSAAPAPPALPNVVRPVPVVAPIGTIAAAAPLKASSAPVKQAPAVAAVPVQEATGALSGNVLDSTGALIPGVTIQLSGFDSRSGDARGKQTAISGETGSFEFSRLPPGRYVIEAYLPGFQTFHSRLFEIRDGERVQQDVTLMVGNVLQRLEVSTVGTPRTAPAVNPPAPRRIRIGGNVSRANLISPVKPIYPESARSAGIQGTVRLQGIIASDGSILSLGVLNEAETDPELAAAARGAVSQWRYKPTLLNGDPVEVVTTIEVDFKLVQ
ncbi:MAG: TonB family protein [Acidobacteria bacterium]|nr:TonB family protein [Acidobacteriota bacterium]